MWEYSPETPKLEIEGWKSSGDSAGFKLMYDVFTKIQQGALEDKYGWLFKVDV